MDDEFLKELQILKIRWNCRNLAEVTKRIRIEKMGRKHDDETFDWL
jgi:hypothetical protein